MNDKSNYGVKSIIGVENSFWYFTYSCPGWFALLILSNFKLRSYHPFELMKM